MAMRLRDGGLDFDHHYELPKDSLMDPLFAPLNLADPSGENLGLIKSHFFLETWGINHIDFDCK